MDKLTTIQNMKLYLFDMDGTLYLGSLILSKFWTFSKPCNYHRPVPKHRAFFANPDFSVGFV